MSLKKLVTSFGIATVMVGTSQDAFAQSKITDEVRKDVECAGAIFANSPDNLAERFKATYKLNVKDAGVHYLNRVAKALNVDETRILANEATTKYREMRGEENGLDKIDVATKSCVEDIGYHKIAAFRGALPAKVQAVRDDLECVAAVGTYTTDSAGIEAFKIVNKVSPVTVVSHYKERMAHVIGNADTEKYTKGMSKEYDAMWGDTWEQGLHLRLSVCVTQYHVQIRSPK